MVSEIFKNQVTFFNTGKTKSIKFRIEALKMLREAIRIHEQDIYKALMSDLGKSKFESYATEIGFVLDEIRYHIKNLKKWTEPQYSISPLTNFPASSYLVHEPLGTVLIIAPWNYPFQLMIAPLVGAISAGNTAILKPSEISSNTSALLEKIINNTFDSDYIKVIEGDASISQSLLKLKFDHIFFTGSPRVGKIIMQEAANQMIPVTLELGGKSPCIVDKDVNLKLAAKRIVWGKLINAGQTCIAPDYIIADSSIKELLIKELKKVIIRFYGIDAYHKPDYPRIITNANVERLASLTKGSTIVYGGKYNVEEKYFEPTIIDNVTLDMPVMQQEIFGPIFPVLTYNNLDEAIKIVNDQPKPLAMYFFSNCKNKQKKIIEETTAGGVTINDTIMHIASNKLPFGGVGNSGTGKYHGKYSFDTFSNKKPVVYKHTWLDIPIRYAPFGNKLRIVKWLMR